MESMRLYISNILSNILFFKFFLHLAITLLYVLSLDLLVLASYAPLLEGRRNGIFVFCWVVVPISFLSLSFCNSRVSALQKFRCTFSSLLFVYSLHKVYLPAKFFLKKVLRVLKSKLRVLKVNFFVP